MREILRQLSYLLDSREKRNGFILLGIMMTGALFEVVGVGAIPAFIGVIAIPEKLLENDTVRVVYDALGVGSPREMVLWAALGLILVFLIKNTYLGFLAYIRARYTSHRQATISNRLFRAYLHSPYTFHLQRNTAELLRNTSMEAVSIANGVVIPLVSIVMEGMVLILIFILLFAIEPLLTLVTFAVFGALAYVYWRMTREKIREYATEEQRYRTQGLQAVNQGIGGFKDARILGREDYFLRSYVESSQYKAEAAQFKTFIQATPRLFLETVAILGLLGVTSVFVVQGRDLDTIVPTLALLAVAVVRMMPSFTKITGSISTLQWGTRNLNVVYQDLVELDALRREDVEGSDEAVEFESEIRLESLDYQYPGQEGNALRDISLTIPKNAAVGFVGPSGAGKTTVVDVLLGLLDPTGGRILVDATDVHNRMSAWQRKIGYIPQQIYLTDDTVRRNVAFGRDDEEIDENDVWAALDAAQLRELVESLPDGLDTEVGEQGIRLSGGQRQRIGIARALYHRPEVLVMDEATSALDNRTEQQFVEALEQLQSDHTLVVIAHRLSTVRNCDTLFMLDQGRLVAEGSYDELMATSEAFRKMAGEEQAPPVALPLAN